jgi:hypothetical protein
MRPSVKRHLAAGIFVLALLTLTRVSNAQQPAAGAAAPPGPPPTAEKAQLFDLTGYWVSVVSEDWRWRMLTPPKGDYASVPLNPAGKKQADTWDPAEDGSCKAYGMAGLMRMPTDLHITWVSPNQLKIDTDWGVQSRTIYFNRADVPTSGATLQGSSLASWQMPVALAIGQENRGSGPKPPGGYLKIVTTQLLPAWLRRNGVPYSAKTTVTEYIQPFTDPSGAQWFDVLTVVEDPEYLAVPYITSSDFRRLPNASSWAPHPCKS